MLLFGAALGDSEQLRAVVQRRLGVLRARCQRGDVRDEDRACLRRRETLLQQHGQLRATVRDVHRKPARSGRRRITLSADAVLEAREGRVDVTHLSDALHAVRGGALVALAARQVHHAQQAATAAAAVCTLDAE